MEARQHFLSKTGIQLNRRVVMGGVYRLGAPCNDLASPGHTAGVLGKAAARLVGRGSA